MTSLKILLILLSINGDKTDTKEARMALLSPVATAIYQAAKGDPDKAAYLIALGASESAFARYVIEGRCLEGKYKCDVDPKTGKPRALGPWQLWEAACRAAHKAGPGSFLQQAGCVLDRASFWMRECRGKGYVVAFSGHAGRACEEHPKWNKREALRQKYRRELQ